MIKIKKPKIYFGMDYRTSVNTLIKQYGVVKNDYFLNESFKSKNHSISRGKEHLYVHHIMEDKAIMLANPKYACNHPFEYQKAKNLVYCNLLEHAILHMSICLHKQTPDNPSELLGFGGLFNFIIPELVDHFACWDYKSQTWRTEENAFLKPLYLQFVVIYSMFLSEIIFEKGLVIDKDYNPTQKYLKLMFEKKKRKLELLDFVPSQAISFYGKNVPKDFLDKYLNIVVDIQIQLIKDIKHRLKTEKTNKFINIDSIING